eukprot:TRINITY_DN1359_c0_g1_i2.p1 TRINITY_DN1359_c0_g1~~TRINITY_DN1359_c0_g1_i2.p1  ORF type:complete len:178 (-),score=28.39 TRINITY_DN1359_c0_g1_i2:101-634(-)
MDEPLFGEQKKSSQVFQYAIGAIVVGFTIFSAVAGVVKAIKLEDGHKHFALVITLLLQLACVLLLAFWYRDKEDRLHPKFKWLLMLLTLTLIMGGVSINTYIWAKGCPPPPTCDGLYDFSRGACISISNLAMCYQPRYCLFMGPTYGSCAFNCTVGGTPSNNYYSIFDPDLAYDMSS